MKSSSLIGRPADRKRTVLESLRRQIVQGQLPPGSRLPLRTELECHYGASPFTIQKALDSLIKDGFVRSRGKLGTFVVDHPPHLTRYAVVFPTHPHEGPHWRRFWTALADQASELAEADNRQLPIYLGIKGHSDRPEYLALIEEVKAHRLAGLIFAIDPLPFHDTPLLDEANMPRVAITGTSRPGVNGVHLSIKSFFDKALDYFAERGRTRVAVIGAPYFQGELESYFLQGLQKRGLDSRPYWRHRIELSMAEQAGRCAQLLFHSRQVEPFDALLITDDNLLEHVSSAVTSLGGDIFGEVEIVAHWNFPAQASIGLPIRRLGYDAREVMQTCIELIDGLRLGSQVPETQLIQAVWEDEIVPPKAAAMASFNH